MASNLIADILAYYDIKPHESDLNMWKRSYKDEIYSAIRRGVSLQKNGRIKDYEDIKKESELYFEYNCNADEEEYN